MPPLVKMAADVLNPLSDLPRVLLSITLIHNVNRHLDLKRALPLHDIRW